ncbi:Cof-type HAD-IIB family hydrolase [Aerococcus suis]|uniref:Haloacid dehalogenase-like hydrolase n=1 Tax=Aerococcus suis TaxID=371602 RepID=A0A1W1Z5E0_9LACT|nr:Cof-type HAD-IIB family hydrolase [Aerococcus suis]MCI7240038.1 Cof-type HAD-IIB family hydrolase [Aerococcus suis]MDD7758627.1 Cof-type HAD-IIB family hydrolase [Aerococcus suis]MDY4646747.1 Cof-type HAD-IIB family hydrolase [Aerococcus suis]SMC43584.1 hypothetical protein SAMN04487984_1133 [Aerococcus suis]
MYKLFVFDIDGTLVNDAKEITPKTHAALVKLHDLGYHVVISSGRPFPGVKRVAEMVGGDLVQYASCFNGGLIKDIYSQETLVQSELAPDDVLELLDFAIQHGVDPHYYNDEHVLTPVAPKFDYIHAEEDLSGLSMKVMNPDEEAIHTPKLMFTAPPEILEQAEAQLPEDYYQRFSIVKSEPYFLEFNPLGVSKGNSLAMLADKLGIKQSEVMTFGDQNNDLSMIEWAGKGVAMGNAITDLKNVADYVTDTNENDGIAQALEEFVFSKE